MEYSVTLLGIGVVTAGPRSTGCSEKLTTELTARDPLKGGQGVVPAPRIPQPPTPCGAMVDWMKLTTLARSIRCVVKSPVQSCFSLRSVKQRHTKAPNADRATALPTLPSSAV